ncbi:hypothetical protein WG66_005449 [Moniliophthora roreri]|nr:hypothetical protein WG66_005449 [Moniliophthora roreri]
MVSVTRVSVLLRLTSGVLGISRREERGYKDRIESQTRELHNETMKHLSSFRLPSLNEREHWNSSFNTQIIATAKIS